MTNTASTLTLPTLIACLQERIVVINEVAGGSVPIEIGGLAELLEEAVQYLQAVAEAPSSFEDDVQSRLHV